MKKLVMPNFPFADRMEDWQKDPERAIRNYNEISAESKGSEPFWWFNSYRALSRSGDILLSQALQATDDYVNEDGSMPFDELVYLDLELYLPACMLYGMAIEAALKGMIIIKHPNFSYTKNKSLLVVRPAHDLRALASKTCLGSKMDDSHLRWLDYLSLVVRGAGRYPLGLPGSDEASPAWHENIDRVVREIRANVDECYERYHLATMGVSPNPRTWDPKLCDDLSQ